jgi:hypothetical protein
MTRALEVVPELRHTAPWRLASVRALQNARLQVTFVDGTAAEVHMQAFLASAGVDGTVFEPLRDPVEFAKASIVMGAVQWPNGAELAPDAMHDVLREDGVWTLE